MELHRLPVDQALRGNLVDRGWARAVRRSTVPTIAQVLAEASARMDEEDEARRLAEDPLAWVRARRPRRLIDLLLGRR